MHRIELEKARVLVNENGFVVVDGLITSMYRNRKYEEEMDEDFDFDRFVLEEGVNPNNRPAANLASCRKCNTLVDVVDRAVLYGEECPNCGNTDFLFNWILNLSYYPDGEFKPELCKESEDEWADDGSADDEGLYFVSNPECYIDDAVSFTDSVLHMYSDITRTTAYYCEQYDAILTGTEESFMDPEEELPELETEFDGKMERVTPPNYGFTDYNWGDTWSPYGHSNSVPEDYDGPEINDGFLPSEVGGEWIENRDGMIPAMNDYISVDVSLMNCDECKYKRASKRHRNKKGRFTK